MNKEIPESKYKIGDKFYCINLPFIDKDSYEDTLDQMRHFANHNSCIKEFTITNVELKTTKHRKTKLKEAYESYEYAYTLEDDDGCQPFNYNETWTEERIDEVFSRNRKTIDLTEINEIKAGFDRYLEKLAKEMNE